MDIYISILEDSPFCTQQLQKLLTKWSHSNNHKCNINTYTSSTTILQDTDLSKYSLYFLAIQLTGDSLTGLDVAKEIRKRGYTGEIIFLTSYREYVFDGYTVNAFHYLLKPITEKSLFPVLDAFCTKHASASYILQTKQNSICIPYPNIIAFTSDLHYVTITTTDVIYHEHIGLNTIAAQLPPYFIRCHRSCIVNLNHVVKIEQNTLYFSHKLTQTISRTYLNKVRSEFCHYLNRLNTT